MPTTQSPHHNLKAACLTSGGLDSIALLFLLVKEYKSIYPIYIKTNLNFEEAEIYYLNKFITSCQNKSLQPLTILNLDIRDLYTNHWSINHVNIPDYTSLDDSVYLPGRNIILLSKSAIWCAQNDINFIALGHLQGNPFPDASQQFMDTIAHAFSIGLNSKLAIIRPFINLNKAKVIKLAKNAPLNLSFSCIDPQLSEDQIFIHCGNCHKCAERIKAFNEARITDLTIYAKSH